MSWSRFWLKCQIPVQISSTFSYFMQTYQPRLKKKKKWRRDSPSVVSRFLVFSRLSSHTPPLTRLFSHSIVYSIYRYRNLRIYNENIPHLITPHNDAQSHGMSIIQNKYTPNNTKSTNTPAKQKRIASNRSIPRRGEKASERLDPDF